MSNEIVSLINSHKVIIVCGRVFVRLITFTRSEETVSNYFFAPFSINLRLSRHPKFAGYYSVGSFECRYKFYPKWVHNFNRLSACTAFRIDFYDEKNGVEGGWAPFVNRFPGA